MDNADKEHEVADLRRELSELGKALRPLFRRVPGAKKAMDKLTAAGDLTGAGAKALESRLHLYRTGNLINEAQKVADATGLPLPAVLDNLTRQRRIDELTIDALRRVSDNGDTHDESPAQAPDADNRETEDRWYHTFFEEAGKVDEEDVKEAFARILVGEMQASGSFSVRTLRAVGTMSRSTANRFRRAASVSIRLTPDGKHVMDARIPAIGGGLGQNCLENEGLSYGVLIDLTENGLVHPDYRSSHSYGPLAGLPSAVQQKLPANFQMPFVHQGKKWMLIPAANPEKAGPVRVVGATLTSCGVELLKIVDVEALPDFTAKLTEHFSQAGYQMVRA